MKPEQLEILILGAGIGGLTAALHLRKRGFNVRVIEKAEKFSRVGAGLQLSPNAVAVLVDLGLGEALAEVACRPDWIETRDGLTGRAVIISPLGDVAEARYGHPYYHVHRSDLHKLLATSFGEHLIEMNSCCNLIEQQSDHKVKVGTECGKHFRGDALIGADGVHSLARRSCFDGADVSHSGYAALRAMIPRDRLPEVDQIDRKTVVWWGPDRHLVKYSVCGGEFVNLVGVVPSERKYSKSWNSGCLADDFSKEFQGWHPEVQHLVAAADRPFATELYDRPPLTDWSHRRVVLLGDAAHPLLPFMAQGAGQSIEDAYVLATAIATHPDFPAAFSEYEEIRRRRVLKIYRRSRKNQKLFHVSGDLPIKLRNGMIRSMQKLDPLYVLKQLDWIYGYDVIAEVGQSLR